MTPKPESETDQWTVIQRYELVQTNFAYTTDHEMERDAEGEWARWEAIDAARAAEAAQHRQEIAALKAEHDSDWKAVEESTAAAGKAYNACRDDNVELRSRLADAEAERDRWKQSSDEQMRSAAEEGDRADTLRVERDRLKAALQDVTIGMDRAGGDRDGMPECPWCQSQGRPEDAEEGYAHDVDCSLMMARAALTTQGQSTDGETR